MSEKFDFFEHEILLRLKVFDKDKKRIVMEGSTESFNLLKFLHLILKLSIVSNLKFWFD